MLKKLFYFGLIAAFVGGFIAYRMWTQPHENIDKRKADISISSKELGAAYARNATAADSTFSDKTLQITGKVVEVSKDSSNNVSTLTLESLDSTNTISCTLDIFSKNAKAVYQVGQTVKLKGICMGVNGGDIQIDRCVPVK
jgi:hypothetical protein